MKGFIRAVVFEFVAWLTWPVRQKRLIAEAAEHNKLRNQFLEALGFAGRFPIPEEVVEQLDKLPKVPVGATSYDIATNFELGAWVRFPKDLLHPDNPEQAVVYVAQVVRGEDVFAAQYGGLGVPERWINRYATLSKVAAPSVA